MSQKNDASMKQSPVIFISHPHKYKDLANVLRTTIIDWTGGNIQPRQTSDYGADQRQIPLIVGDNVRSELEKSLSESNLVLLLYVEAKTANWCMFEAGFAKANGIRVIVLQCGTEKPSIFEGDLIITLTKDSIQQFTRDFHRATTFFPGFNKAYAPDLPGEYIKARAMNLHSRLNDEWQRVRPDKYAAPKISPRWIMFTLSLDDTYKDEIYKIVDNSDNFKEALIKAQELIEQHCVIQHCDPHLLKHFGLSRVTDDRKFFTLYHRWKGKLQRANTPQYIAIDWWSQTCKQITYSIGAINAEEIVIPFKSGDEKLTWYLLVVTCQRTVPAEERIEFDCTLIRIPDKSDYINLTVPGQA